MYLADVGRRRRRAGREGWRWPAEVGTRRRAGRGGGGRRRRAGGGGGRRGGGRGGGGAEEAEEEAARRRRPAVGSRRRPGSLTASSSIDRFLSENGGVGGEEGRGLLKQRPLVPVRRPNRDQRVFRSGWWQQPGLKADPLVPVGATNRTERQFSAAPKRRAPKYL